MCLYGLFHHSLSFDVLDFSIIRSYKTRKEFSFHQELHRIANMTKRQNFLFFLKNFILSKKQLLSPGLFLQVPSIQVVFCSQVSQDSSGFYQIHSIDLDHGHLFIYQGSTFKGTKEKLGSLLSLMVATESSLTLKVLQMRLRN